MRISNKEADELGRRLRRQVIEIGYRCGTEGAHFGGTLSLIELMISLYKNVIPETSNHEDHDKVIMSKGHGVLAQYLLMGEVGLLSKDEVLRFKQDYSVCSAHPSRNLTHNIEYSSGSLGQGLSLGLGVALARKSSNKTGKVFVILGDGECDEGNIWEAAGSAAQYNTDNLVAIIDKNEIQYDAPTDSVMNLRDMKAKFHSFGWDSEDVDGHDVEQISNVLLKNRDKPFALIAHTIKGKGISFMEGKPEWHHKILSEELFHLAMKELNDD